MNNQPAQSLLVVERRLTLEHAVHFAREGCLWSIIDACDALDVPVKMRELGPENALCLLPEEYCMEAPYIVRTDEDTLAWLEKNLWKSPWGILFISKEPIEVLYRHCQNLLYRTLGDGNVWYFRYYDPRVLDKYMRNHLPVESTAMFGPLIAFGIGFGEDTQWTAFSVKSLSG